MEQDDENHDKANNSTSLPANTVGTVPSDPACSPTDLSTPDLSTPDNEAVKEPRGLSNYFEAFVPPFSSPIPLDILDDFLAEQLAEPIQHPVNPVAIPLDPAALGDFLPTRRIDHHQQPVNPAAAEPLAPAALDHFLATRRIHPHQQGAAMNPVPSTVAAPVEFSGCSNAIVDKMFDHSSDLTDIRTQIFAEYNKLFHQVMSHRTNPMSEKKDIMDSIFANKALLESRAKELREERDRLTRGTWTNNMPPMRLSMQPIINGGSSSFVNQAWETTFPTALNTYAPPMAAPMLRPRIFPVPPPTFSTDVGLATNPLDAINPPTAPPVNTSFGLGLLNCPLTYPGMTSLPCLHSLYPDYSQGMGLLASNIGLNQQNAVAIGYSPWNIPSVDTSRYPTYLPDETATPTIRPMDFPSLLNLPSPTAMSFSQCMAVHNAPTAAAIAPLDAMIGTTASTARPATPGQQSQENILQNDNADVEDIRAPGTPVPTDVLDEYLVEQNPRNNNDDNVHAVHDEEAVHLDAVQLLPWDNDDDDEDDEDNEENDNADNRSLDELREENEERILEILRRPELGHLAQDHIMHLIRREHEIINQQEEEEHAGEAVDVIMRESDSDDDHEEDEPEAPVVNNRAATSDEEDATGFLEERTFADTDVNNTMNALRQQYTCCCCFALREEFALCMKGGHWACCTKCLKKLKRSTFLDGGFKCPMCRSSFARGEGNAYTISNTMADCVKELKKALSKAQ